MHCCCRSLEICSGKAQQGYKAFDFFTQRRGKHLDIISLIIFLAIGALVGWLAGKIYKGSGFGMLGIIAGGLLGSIVMGTVGAVLLLFLIGLVKKNS